MLPFQRAESLFYARPAPIWQAEIIAIRDVSTAERSCRSHEADSTLSQIHDVLRRHAFSAADWGRLVTTPRVSASAD